MMIEINKLEKIIEIFSYPEDNPSLQEEFVKLFINDFEGIKCSPYAFDYFKNISHSEFFINLKNLYKSAGLEISSDFKEREDHLIVLIEFLIYLIELKVPDYYIKKFFNNYLFWIPDFVNKLRDVTANNYFLKGAKLLEELYEEIQNN